MSSTVAEEAVKLTTDEKDKVPDPEIKTVKQNESVNTVSDDEVEDDETTAESVLSAAKSYLDCPVCYDTLVSPIYQCQNGHIVCNSCIEKITSCGVCRVPLGGVKIRNVALENICKGVSVKCPNNLEGCKITTTVEKLKIHLESCEYHPIQFCRKHLGWKDCEVSVTDVSVVEHLLSDHPVKKLNNSVFRLRLNVWGTPLSEQEVHFDPLIVSSLQIPILLRSVVSMDGNISFTSFILQNRTRQDKKEYQIKYRIETPNKDACLEWTGFVQPYRDFRKMNCNTSFRFPIDSLKECCEYVQESVYAKARTIINVKVAVWDKSGQPPKFDDEFNIYEDAEIFGQSCAHDPNSSSTTVYETVTCDGCRMKPIRDIRYKCMQCADYDLCSRCMDRRYHSHHLFVRIQNLDQNFVFSNEFHRRGNALL